ncbi:GNAT family N-acetyltransferase [Streptomyces mirabilis]|uniref:GNAT family N-acetyltransferase n=1 Tax=Streptomyces mirabilis TaxID=68239 RepID=UPI0036D91137
MDVGTTVYQGDTALGVVEEFVHLRLVSSREHSPERDEKVAAEVRERIADEVRRPGFLAVTARIGSRLCGFGTAVRSADPAPEHPVLGARRSQEWLAGAVRITDLVVAPAARGRGVGTGILDILLLPAMDDRAWAVTDHQDTTALNFFRCWGWRQTVYPRPGAHPAQIVLLAPRHPTLSEIPVLP